MITVKLANGDVDKCFPKEGGDGWSWLSADVKDGILTIKSSTLDKFFTPGKTLVQYAAGAWISWREDV